MTMVAYTTDLIDTGSTAEAGSWDDVRTQDAGGVTRPPRRGAGSSAPTVETAEGLGAVAGLGARIAGLASVEEHRQLVSERRALALRQLARDFTEADRRSLRLVEWHLDRIESARYQDSLEPWRVAARDYARLAAEVSGLVEAIGASLPVKSRRR